MAEDANVKVPDNVSETKVNPQNEIEQRASQHGWKPEAEWEGDPGEWRSAKEFLDRQSLFDKIDSLKSTIWELKRDYRTVHESVAKAERAKYETEIAELKRERKQAAKEGDTEKVVEISDQIEQAQQNVKQAVAVPAQQGPDPAFSEWVTENKWYVNNKDMKADADAFGFAYKNDNPNASFQDVLKHVNAKMRKVYPEEMGVKKVNNAPNVDGGGSTRPRSTSSDRLSESDLTEVERTVMNKYVKLKIYGNIPEAEAKKKYMESLRKVKENK